MNLAKFAIERNRLTFAFLGLVLFIGIGVFSSLSRDSMPPYTVKVATIVAPFPGAGPERVEQLVTDKLEKIVQEIPELKEMTSTSRSGLSVIIATLKDEVVKEELQPVWDRLRRKLNGVQGLPQGVFTILDDDGIGDVYGIAVGLTSDGYSYAEMKKIADDIRDDIIRLDDAAKVKLGGVQEERIFIEFNNDRLKDYGLTSLMLSQIIGATNILSTGGAVNVGDERIQLEPTGNFKDIEEVKNMLIPIGDGTSKPQLIMLKDITTVTKGYVTPTAQKVLVNGQPAISFHINLKDNANVINLGKDVDQVIADWQSQLPIGLELTRISSIDEYIKSKVNNFMINLVQAVVIVLLIMLIFLGFKTGMIVASLIPIVSLMTLTIMGLIDMGLNQVTLAALIIALGMLVDNAIVVVETLKVKIDNGTPVKEAALASYNELFAPLLVSTLSISAAFLAFYLSPTIMGDIVGPIFIVVAISLLSSWLVALTVIPLFCFIFLKANKGQEPKKGFIDKVIISLRQKYQALVLIALVHKCKVLLSIAVIFVVALLGFGKIQFLFFPDSDRNMITVDINLPSGTGIDATANLVKEIDTYITDSLKINDERKTGVADWSAYIGQGPEVYDLGYSQDEANSSYAHIIVNTSSMLVNKDMVEKIDNYCYTNFPNADIKVKTLQAGGSTIPIEIKVSGKDADELAKIATSVKRQLASIPGTKNVKDDWGPKSKKLLIDIDQSRALAVGITSQDIAVSLETTLDGFLIGEYREDNKTIPIMMRNSNDQEKTISFLETVNIYAQSSGLSVPLSQVASIVPEWEYGKIKRYNLRRSVNISCELRATGNAAVITEEISPWLASEMEKWPSGYKYEFGGDAKQTAESMNSVIGYLPISALIIIILLTFQFNSFRKTTMILMTIPLAIIGVVVGLLISGEPFGFMPFLGVISLAGIVINNAIVLIDCMNTEHIKLKKPIQDAIISACLQRFRPILLATFTTVLGLIPLYLSGGELWEGMAVTIMTGLLFGTTITLVFIPSMYSLLYKVKYKNDYKYVSEI